MSVKAFVNVYMSSNIFWGLDRPEILRNSNKDSMETELSMKKCQYSSMSLAAAMPHWIKEERVSEVVGGSD